MKIIADGKYTINRDHAMSKSVIYMPALVGGATISLEVQGVPVEDGTLVVSTQTRVYHGKDIQLILVVSGFSGDPVEIKCVGLH